MSVLSGRVVADEVLGRLALRTAALARSGLRQPQLVIVECGNDPRSAVYIRNKVRTADRVGVRVRVDSVDPGPAAQAQLLQRIARCNRDNEVHGIIVQMPLPPHVEAGRVLRAVDDSKDVDGLAPANTGELESASVLGSGFFLPATALGILVLLRWVERQHLGGFTLRGKHCVVVGKGALAGAPTARLLSSEALVGCTVSACDVDTPHPTLRALLRMADVVVTAAGVALISDPSWLKAGAVVIDAGIRVEDEGVRGDVDWRELLPRCSYITPTPGGTGLMTVAALLVQVVQAAEQQQGQLQQLFEPLARERVGEGEGAGAEAAAEAAAATRRTKL